MSKYTLEQIQQQTGGRMLRTAEVGAINFEKRTVDLAFSSEAEVERWFGIEILSHEPGACDLSRIKNSGPLLFNHHRDQQIGVAESVSIDADKKGRARVRFGNSPLADEKFRDVQDKILVHVSVGYTIDAAKLTEERDNGVDVWTITQWEPYEISFVTIPADTEVGIGRSLDNPADPPPAPTPEPEQKPITDNPSVTTGARSMTATVDDNEPQKSDAQQISELAKTYARNLPDAHSLATRAIEEGKTAGEFQRVLLDKMMERSSRSLTDQSQDSDIGLSGGEIERFSFMRLARHLADPNDKRMANEAAFELEVCGTSEREYLKAGGDMKKNARHIPTDILTRALPANGIKAGVRALNTLKDGLLPGNTGGNAVATNLMAQAFIDILVNKAFLLGMSSSMGGLVGNVDIPKKTAKGQVYWVGEGQNVSESMLEIGLVKMSPKTAGAYTDITRRLLEQSSLGAEALVRQDLALALAQGIDLAGYYGTGTDYQPRGIGNTTGVRGVDFAATQPTFAELVDMETQIALSNADVDSMAYVGNAKLRGHAKSTLKFPGVSGSQTIWEQGGTLNGYQTKITNQIADGDVLMGNFADLVVGMWGGIQLMVDPYSNSTSGTLRLVIFQDVDFAVRRVESFAFGRKSVVVTPP